MKNLLIVTILLLILFSCSKPQTTPEFLNSFCEDLSFSKLIKELKKQQKEDTLFEYKFGVWQERDIIDSYRENIFVVSKSKKNIDFPNEINYLKLIIKDSSIVSYKIYNSIFDNEIRGFGWVSNELLFFKKNKKEIEILKKSFKSTYKTDLNYNELFRTDLNFGRMCGGISSSPTSEILEISSLVENRNLDFLENWLQSSHTEKQLYGLVGYYHLKDSVKFRSYIPKLVHAIENKKGTYSSCGGCIYSQGKIEDVIERIRQNDFSPNFDSYFDRRIDLMKKIEELENKEKGT